MESRIGEIIRKINKIRINSKFGDYNAYGFSVDEKSEECKISDVSTGLVHRFEENPEDDYYVNLETISFPRQAVNIVIKSFLASGSGRIQVTGKHFIQYDEDHSLFSSGQYAKTYDALIELYLNPREITTLHLKSLPYERLPDHIIKLISQLQPGHTRGR